MKLRLFLLLLTVAAAAGIAVLVFHSRSERHSAPDSARDADRIKIEVRAMPRATIHVDGKKIGTTPMSLQYAKSQRQIVVEATMMRRLFKRDAKIDETYKESRTITLDRDQLLDFTLDSATLVHTEETVIERPPPNAAPEQPAKPR